MEKIKILFFGMLFILFYKNSTVFAYDNGLLQGKMPSSFFGDFKTSDLSKVTDNDLSSFVRFNSAPYFLIYTLENPTDISKIFIKSSDYFTLYFYDPAGRQINQQYVKIGSTIGQKFDINISNVKSIKIFPLSYGYNLFELDIYPIKDNIPPAPVSNLIATEIGSDYFSISFNNPLDKDFIGNNIYINDVLKTTLDKTKNSYTFTNLNPNTSYTVKVISFDDNYNYSNETKITIRTLLPPPEEVKNLALEAEYDRVKLSWTPPDSEFFHHVKIYRKKVEQQSFWDQLFGTTAVSAETTSDGYTPMFETNGTYWTDLTVTPETTYSYKVTSVNIEGDESQGVTVETTTPSEPVPVLTGVATTQNENGDYVVTWASPTKGIVKVLIAGKEYAQVDAATKQIVIKKEDMKTDLFGAYAATLIPIGEYGTEGQAVNVPSLGGKIDFPLSFQDFIETTISILAWVAPFILLSLVFIFWRPIFNFIKKAISERRVKQ